MVKITLPETKSLTHFRRRCAGCGQVDEKLFTVLKAKNDGKKLTMDLQCPDCGNKITESHELKNVVDKLMGATPEAEETPDESLE